MMMVLLLYDFNNTMRGYFTGIALSREIIEYWYWANSLFNSASDNDAAATAVSDSFGIA